VKPARLFTAAVVVAALSLLPAAAQAEVHNQHRNTRASRQTDQTPAQRTLARVLGRELRSYPAPDDPQTQAAQAALGRTLAREDHAYWSPTDGQQSAKSHQTGPSGTFPLVPLLLAVGLTGLLMMAATWRRLRG